MIRPVPFVVQGVCDGIRLEWDTVFLSQRDRLRKEFIQRRDVVRPARNFNPLDDLLRLFARGFGSVARSDAGADGWRTGQSPVAARLVAVRPLEFDQWSKLLWYADFAPMILRPFRTDDDAGTVFVLVFKRESTAGSRRKNDSVGDVGKQGEHCGSRWMRASYARVDEPATA